MSWIVSQTWRIVKPYWWAVLVGWVILAAVFAVFGALVFFTAALVIVTFLLALVTTVLARANQSLAEGAIRTEVRTAIDAAKHFLEIKQDEFVESLTGNAKDGVLDAVGTLASFGNCLRDSDTVRDLQNLASEIDTVKIGNASINDAKDKLTKLQGRMINELVLMRRDLRDVSRALPLGQSGSSSPPREKVPGQSYAKRRLMKAGALIVVIASVFVWGAGFVGERAFGGGVGFWLYWEAILFLAVWTLQRALGTVIGWTKHTVWMFQGWVLLSMVLASLLFIIVGPAVLLLTLNLTLGLAIMLAGMALWVVGAVMWFRYELLQNRRQLTT